MTVKTKTVFVVSYLDRAAEAVRKQGFSGRKLALDFAQAKARDTRYDFVTITPQQRVSWSDEAPVPPRVDTEPHCDSHTRFDIDCIDCSDVLDAARKTSALLRPQAPGVPEGMTLVEYGARS